MVYDIKEISTVKGSQSTYVLAEFWQTDAERAAGQSPLLREEFLLDLKTEGTRVVRDEKGRWQLADGSFITSDELQAFYEKGVEIEFTRETFAYSPKQDILAACERFAAAVSAKKWSGDRTSDPSKPLYVDGRPVEKPAVALIERDKSDPKGVLSDAEVGGLVVATVEPAREVVK